jgi:outer membrane receptor protein involved in Fe transport
MSKRYGDALHEEALPSHVVVDLSMRYRRDRLWQLKNISVNLEFRNLFDSHHIGVVELFDDGAAGKASYYSAAPFSTVFGASAEW